MEKVVKTISLISYFVESKKQKDQHYLKKIIFSNKEDSIDVEISKEMIIDTKTRKKFFTLFFYFNDNLIFLCCNTTIG